MKLFYRQEVIAEVQLLCVLKTNIRRVLVRPKLDHYALAPAYLQHLSSLLSKGEKEKKSIDITSVDKVPYTIPEGNAVANNQTPLFAMGLFPLQRYKPLTN